MDTSQRKTIVNFRKFWNASSGRVGVTCWGARTLRPKLCGWRNIEIRARARLSKRQSARSLKLNCLATRWTRFTYHVWLTDRHDNLLLRLYLPRRRLSGTLATRYEEHARERATLSNREDAIGRPSRGDRVANREFRDPHISCTGGRSTVVESGTLGCRRCRDSVDVSILSSRYSSDKLASVIFAARILDYSPPTNSQYPQALGDNLNR